MTPPTFWDKTVNGCQLCEGSDLFSSNAYWLSFQRLLWMGLGNFSLCVNQLSKIFLIKQLLRVSSSVNCAVESVRISRTTEITFCDQSPLNFRYLCAGVRRISSSATGSEFEKFKSNYPTDSFCLLCEFTVDVKTQNDCHATSVMLVVECGVWKYNGFLNRKVKWNCKMADLEAVLADVSYLMAMEKSKCTPAARASKKIVLPDPR